MDDTYQLGIDWGGVNVLGGCASSVVASCVVCWLLNNQVLVNSVRMVFWILWNNIFYSFVLLSVFKTLRLMEE